MRSAVRSFDHASPKPGKKEVPDKLEDATQKKSGALCLGSGEAAEGFVLGPRWVKVTSYRPEKTWFIAEYSGLKQMHIFL